ncbi:hypothetical protein F5880DRAFT_1509454 [Lentinula raphanica]|nr:hypothetical protein F5880DRAFT_1509454 [Lentinula raphanica]
MATTLHPKSYGFEDSSRLDHDTLLQGLYDAKPIAIHILGTEPAEGDLKRPFKSAPGFFGAASGEPQTDKVVITEAEKKCLARVGSGAPGANPTRDPAIPVPETPAVASLSSSSSLRCCGIGLALFWGDEENREREEREREEREREERERKERERE